MLYLKSDIKIEDFYQIHLIKKYTANQPKSLSFNHTYIYREAEQTQREAIYHSSSSIIFSSAFNSLVFYGGEKKLMGVNL